MNNTYIYTHTHHQYTRFITTFYPVCNGLVHPHSVSTDLHRTMGERMREVEGVEEVGDVT